MSSYYQSKAKVFASYDAAVKAVANAANLTHADTVAMCNDFDGIVVPSSVGDLRIKFYRPEQHSARLWSGGWLHMRFDNVAMAVQHPAVQGHILNHYSGKYNAMSLTDIGPHIATLVAIHANY